MKRNSMKFRQFFAHFDQSMTWTFLILALLSMRVASLHNKRIKSRRPSLSSINLPDLVLDRRSSFNRAYRTDIVSDSGIFVENKRKVARPNTGPKSGKGRNSENTLGYSNVAQRRNSDKRLNSLGIRRQAVRRPKKSQLNMGMNLRKALDVIHLRKTREHAIRKAKKAVGNSPNGVSRKYEKTKRKVPTTRTMNLGKYLNKVFRNPKTVTQERNRERMNSKRKLRKEVNHGKTYNTKSLKGKGMTQKTEQSFSFPIIKQKVSSYARNQDYGDSTTPGLSLGNAFVPWDGFENLGLPVTPSISNDLYPQGGTSKESVTTYRGIEIRYPDNHVYDLPPEKTKTSFDNRGNQQHYNLFDRIGITDVPASSAKFDSNVRLSDYGQYTATPSDIVETGYSVTTPQMKKMKKFRNSEFPYVNRKSEWNRPNFNVRTLPSASENFNEKSTNDQKTNNKNVRFPASDAKFEHRIIHHPMNENDKHRLPVHQYTSNTLYESQGNPKSHVHTQTHGRPVIKANQQGVTFKFQTNKSINNVPQFRKASIQNRFVSANSQRMRAPQHGNTNPYSGRGNQKKNMFSMKMSTKSNFKKSILRNELQGKVPPKLSKANAIHENSRKSSLKHRKNTYSTSNTNEIINSKLNSAMNNNEDMPPIIIPVTTQVQPTETSLFDNRTELVRVSTSKSKTKSSKKHEKDSYVLLSGQDGNQNSLIMESLVLDDNHHLTKKLAPYIEGRVETSSPSSSATPSSTNTSSRTSGAVKISTLTPTIRTSTITVGTIEKDGDNKLSISTTESNNSNTSLELSLNETSTAMQINTTISSNTSFEDGFVHTSYNESASEKFNETTQANLEISSTNNSNISITDKDELNKLKNDTDNRIIEQDTNDMNTTNLSPSLETIPNNYTKEQRTDTVMTTRYTDEGNNDSETLNLINHDVYDHSNVRFISTLSTQEATFPSTISLEAMTTTTDMDLKGEQTMHLAKGQNSSIWFKDTTARTWEPSIQNQKPRNDATKRHEIPNVEWLSKSANAKQIKRENNFVLPSEKGSRELIKHENNALKDKPKLALPSVDNKIPVEKIPCNDTFNKQEMVTIAFGILQLLLQNVKLQKTLRHKESVDQSTPKRKYLLIPLSMAEEKGLNDIIPKVVSGMQNPAIVDYYTPPRHDDRNFLYSKAMTNLKKKKNMLQNSIRQEGRQTQYANEAGLRRSHNLLKLMQKKNKHFAMKNYNSIAPKSEIFFPNRF